MSATVTLGSILEMGRSGDDPRFVPLACAALAQGAEDAQLRLTLVQHLMQAGLLKRAAAFAVDLPPEVQTHPEVAPILTALRESPTHGQVPWSRFDAQFRANVAALRGRYPWIDELLGAWRAERRHLELHLHQQFGWLVFDRRPRADGGWRPSYAPQVPSPDAETLSRQVRGRVCAPLLLDGVGLGHHLPWLAEATADTLHGATPRIYQVEPSWAGLAVALHLNDWTAEIASPRVHLCAGPDAFAQLASAIEGDAWTMPPGMVVSAAPWEPDAPDRVRATCAEVEARHQERQEAVRSDLLQAYAERDVAYWRDRFATAAAGNGPPLRVMGITSRFTTVLQYVMRDAVRALDELGCETRLLIEPTNHALLTPLHKLQATRDFQPDLILLIDHLRHEYPGTFIPHIPMVSWIQDRLPWLFSPEAGRQMGPLDFCIGLSRKELVEQFDYPADRFLPCPIPTDANALAGNDATMAERFACDVAFASNATVSPDELLQRAPAEAHALCRTIMDELHARCERGELNGGLRVDLFTQQMEEESGVALDPGTRHDLARGFVRDLTDLLLRRQTVTWAAEWADDRGRRLHLYGKGWEALPRFAPYARGYVEHGPALGAAFRQARVNLHTGCNVATHQRVLDGLAAGGFFLVRRHSEDIAWAVKEEQLTFIAASGAQAGDVFTPDQLPPALAARRRALLRMRGQDPETPLKVSPAHIARTQKRATPAEHIPTLIWPQFEQLTFGTRAELWALLDRYVDDEHARGQFAADMRARTLATFGMRALMQRVVTWLTETLGRG